jgi:hypothetical protein
MLANDRVAENLMVSDWREIRSDGAGLGVWGAFTRDTSRWSKYPGEEMWKSSEHDMD